MNHTHGVTHTYTLTHAQHTHTGVSESACTHTGTNTHIANTGVTHVNP